jgi:hypothetical protein
MKSNPQDLIRYLDKISIDVYNDTEAGDVLYCITQDPTHDYYLSEVNRDDLVVDYTAVNNVVTGKWLFIFDNFSTCDKVRHHLNRWRHTINDVTDRYFNEIIAVTN